MRILSHIREFAQIVSEKEEICSEKVTGALFLVACVDVGGAGSASTLGAVGVLSMVLGHVGLGFHAVFQRIHLGKQLVHLAL